MLLEWIKSQIESNGPVTVARFMEWALYHPEWGYYTRGPQIGPRGDFTTSPEASTVFGAVLARHIMEVDTLLERPQSLHILECGPGRGTLARDILESLRNAAPDVYARARYLMLEISPALKQMQETLLGDGYTNRVEWISSLSELTTGIQGAVIANEFLDAFPVHVLSRQDGELVEQYVDVGQEGELICVYDRISSSHLNDFVQRYGLRLEDGERIEVSLGAAEWLAELSTCLERGVACFFDYGDTHPKRFSEARRAGTLLGYRGGAVTDNPLAHPGEQDLTALVDFTHLSDTAMDAGFDLLGITRQATFLVGLGLGEGSTATLAHNNVDGALEYRKGLQALISMEGLGRFHVMLLAKGMDPDSTRQGLSGLRFIDIL